MNLLACGHPVIISTFFFFCIGMKVNAIVVLMQKHGDHHQPTGCHWALPYHVTCEYPLALEPL